MFTRLTRKSPWGAQIGCGIVLSFIVMAPGFFIGYMTYTRDHSDNRNALFGFSAVWIAVGILVLLSQIHQVFASRSPETIVEIDPLELKPGESVRIHVIQPGPLRLQSIHANLSGEDTTISFSAYEKTTNTKRTTKYIGPFRMIEIERYDIGGGEVLEREATFRVPPDIPASLESSGRTIRWTIEVWGRVAWWPDFMHPFPVTVTIK